MLPIKASGMINFDMDHNLSSRFFPVRRVVRKFRSSRDSAPKNVVLADFDIRTVIIGDLNRFNQRAGP